MPLPSLSILHRMTKETVKLPDFRKNQSKMTLGKKDIQVPELALLLGTKPDVIPVIKVRQATLSEQLTASALLKGQGALEGFLAGLAGIMSDMESEDKTEKKKAIEAVVSAAEVLQPQMHPDAAYEISLCLSCIEAPKFAKADIVWIAKNYPRVINKIATGIQQLTIKGAQKKTIKA